MASQRNRGILGAVRVSVVTVRQWRLVTAGWRAGWLTAAVCAGTLLQVGCSRQQAQRQSEPAVSPATATPEPSSPEATQEAKVTGLTIESSAFSHQGGIPKPYTCQGDDLSPPLSWSGVPEGTRSLALIVHDPDVPDPAAPKRIWVHWIVYDIPPTESALAAGVKQLPAGAKDGTNDWNRTGYGGPCPPIGRHRYFHRLYALDVALGDLGKPTKPVLEKAMQGHILGQAELVGTYQK